MHQYLIDYDRDNQPLVYFHRFSQTQPFLNRIHFLLLFISCEIRDI